MIRQTSTAAALFALATISAMAQPADRPNRYSMAPAEGGGFARLDTVTGSMSICQRKDADWTCRDMDDDGRRLRQENDRLAAENLQLKAELKRLEDTVAGMPGARPGADPEGPARTFKLPSEEEVDKALSYVERMFKKFRDKLKELETDKGSTPL